MDNKEISTQEWHELDNRIKEVGRKCHEKQLQNTWVRACKQMLQDISDEFSIMKRHPGNSIKDVNLFANLSESIKSFPIPEYREAEQKEMK